MITTETTPIVAFKDFFGLKTGQTLMQFKAEIDQFSPAQQALLDQYNTMAFRASDDLHSFVMFNTPAGHALEPVAVQIHQQWQRDFGFSYVGRVPKGIAVVGVP